MKRKTEALDSDLKNREGQLISAREQHDAAKAEIAELQKKLDGGGDTSEEAAKKRIDTEKRLETLVGEHAASTAGLKESLQRAEQLQGELQLRNKELSETRTRLENVRTEVSILQARLEHQTEAAQQASELKAQAESRLEAFTRQQGGTSTNQNADLARQIEEATKERDALKAAQEKANAELNESRQKMSAISGDLAKRDSEMAELRTLLDAAKVESVTLRGKLEGVVAQGAQQNGAGQGDASQRIAALEREAATLRADLQRAKRDSGELRRQVDLAAKSLRDAAEARKTEAAAPGKIRELEAERDRLTASLEKANSELTSAIEQLQQARGEKEPTGSGGAPSEKGPGTDRIKVLEAERDAARQELEAVKAGLERAKQHVTAMQSRRDQMREEISRLKSALGHAPDAMS